MAFGFGIGKNKVLVYSVDEFSTQVNAVVDPKLALKQDQHVRTTGRLLSTGWSTDEWNRIVQTIQVTGMTENSTVFVSAVPTDLEKYNSYGVSAVNQGNGTLTFMCKSEPTSNIDVYIVIFGV